MAQIAFVHGIANEQWGADKLEADWRMQLAGGVRVAGFGDLADRLTRDRALAGAVDCRMAFYGDLFLKPGRQGGESSEILDNPLTAALAEEWLRNVKDRARDATEKDNAERALASISPQAGRQGAGASIALAIRALTKVRWFADPLFGAATFVHKALGQVTSYLENREVRPVAQERVLAVIGPETRVLIGHSLGSVVAWEALHRRPVHELRLLITIGSPLGLRNVVYDKLWPQPPTFPPKVKKWINIADTDDFIASEPDLGSLFPSTSIPPALFTGTWAVDNGASPHNAQFYLGKEMIGRSVADALS